MTAKTKNNDASKRTDLPNYDVAVMGRGNSAALTALALADHGFSVWAETAQASAENSANNESAATWQRVLALSPGARRALEALGVWQRLEAGHAPVADIAVGGPNDRDLPLRFAAGTGHNQPVDILSHIVSVADLTAAIGRLARVHGAYRASAGIGKDLRAIRFRPAHRHSDVFGRQTNSYHPAGRCQWRAFNMAATRRHFVHAP